MMDTKLYCSRPHVKSVDFQASRFVVRTPITVSGRRLEMGDLVPEGELSEDALRQEYDRPLRRIELLEYALSDPDLREACARRGLDVSGVLTDHNVPDPPPTSSPTLNLDSLDKDQLADLCKANGLPTHGSRKALRDRLAALLG